MPRLSHPDNGYHFCNDIEAEELKKTGWKICTDEDWAEIIAKKRSGNIEIAEPVETEVTTFEAPTRPVLGRPKKS